MGRQTTVQDSNTIRFGSCKIEVGATVGALTDIGAANSVVMKEERTEYRIVAHNAGEVAVGIKDQKVKVDFDLMEANLTILNTLRGGVDTYSTAAAAPVNVTNENVVMTGVTGQRLAYKNGAGTIVTAIVVDNSVGVPYTLNTDYSVGIDSAGYTVITRIAGAGISDGETVKVDYTYTPNTSKTLSSGGKFTMTPKVLRLTNTNEAGDILRVTFFRARSAGGIDFTYNADDDENPNLIKVTMEATRDETLAAGAQLFEILDEQAP